MKRKLILLALMPFLAVSCLERDMEEAVPALQTDVDEIFEIADIYSGDSDLTKVVKIISNRSWSAHLNDLDNPIDETDPEQSVTWGYLSVESHPNLSNATEEFNLVVNFNRNYEKRQINGILNIYSDGKKAASVKLTQAPVKYHLKVSSDVSKVGEHAESVPVTVDCNTAWTVRLDGSTTADIAPMDPNGFDPTVINVGFSENEEKTTKTAKLIFSAEDCEDVSIEFTQDPSTSELDVFEIFLKLETTGTRTTAVPTLVLDREKMFEKYPKLADSKVKFYYTSTTEAGEDSDVPTKKHSSIPDEGWSVRPLTPGSFNYLCVYILGIADGYRDCYCKAYVRDWIINKNHIKSSGYGLTIGNESKLSPQTNYVTCDKDNYFSCAALEGGHGQIHLRAHNASNSPTGVFSVAGNTASTFNFEAKATSTSPETFISSVFDCSMGDDIRFTSTEAKTFLWDITVLEMKKVKL